MDPTWLSLGCAQGEIQANGLQEGRIPWFSVIYRSAWRDLGSERSCGFLDLTQREVLLLLELGPGHSQRGARWVPARRRVLEAGRPFLRQLTTVIFNFCTPFPFPSLPASPIFLSLSLSENCYILFLRLVSPCSPDQSGTCRVDQAGLQLTERGG